MKKKFLSVLFVLVLSFSLVSAIPVLAQGSTTTTLTMPDNVYRPEEFVVSSTTTNAGTAYTNVRLNITLSGFDDFTGSRADTFTITKVNGSTDTQGVNDTFVLQNGDWVGYWGPAGGFPLSDPYDTTITFTIEMNNTTASLVNYNLTVAVVDLTPEPDVILATATDSYSLSADTLYVGKGNEQFTTIQAAIDAANTGYIINVAAGTYNENVNVDKSLTLQGASSATVTVNAADSNVDVFMVTASDVNISEFTVSGATLAGHAGIYLNAGVAYCNISNNIVTGNWDGIWLGAGSNHNTLHNNDVSGNEQGFEVYISDYNTFTDNIANLNTRYGFKIDSGNYNQFTNNLANSNDINGFYVVEGDGGGYTNTTFTNNTANLNAIYGFRLHGGSGNTLTGNTCDSNGTSGIRLKEATLTLTLENNNFTNNPIGIEITDSVADVSTWTVSHNNIVGNTSYGISNIAITGTLNAGNNWWGDASGPSVQGPGTGDAISTNVDYSPWMGAVVGTSPMVWYTNDSIQAAIDAASAGDTINVAAGTYNENVNVDKSLTLQGASSATVTVNAADSNVDVFMVTASDVNISEFTVSGATLAGHAGIYLNAGVAYCNISNNIVTGNWDGIWLGAGSNHNTLHNNNVSGNTRQGFEVYISDYNTFTGNIANSNTSYGFKIDSGNYNQFTNNLANSNDINGFYVVEGDGGGYTNTTFTNNTANLNAIYGFRLHGGSGNTLTGNTFDSNGTSGIRLKEATLTLTLENNNFTNNPIGIEITDSVADVSTWIVSHNSIVGNTIYGISNIAITGTLDARENWWGSIYGPTHSTNTYNPGEQGNAVSDNVDFVPWCFDEACTITMTGASENLHTGQSLIHDNVSAWYNGSGSAYISLASFSGNPAADDPVFTSGSTEYYDVMATNLTYPTNAYLTVDFPSSGAQQLQYWNGTSWKPVLNDDGGFPVSSGSIITVVFGPNSTPKLSELTGTFITVTDLFHLVLPLIFG